MTRLAAYLVRMFSADALALLAIVSFLLFLAQALRTFDVVTVKGQDLLTLTSLSLLSMPTLVLAFAHLCIGIGLARGLGALQHSQELHIIHASRRMPALFGAIGTYTALGMGVVLLLSGVIEPLTKQQGNVMQADITADLVRRTLTPNKFIELTPGVTLVIGARGANGEIGSFFADDRRGEEGQRRTYIAQSAALAVDETGYVIKLRDGTIQNMSETGRYSEISFATYDLAIDRLSRAEDATTGIGEMTSIELLAGIVTGNPRSGAADVVFKRFTDSFKTLALCLFVAAVAAFPRGDRRGRGIPLELVVILAAFGELGLSGVLTVRALPNAGAVLMIVAAVGVIAWRLRPHPLPRAAVAT